MNDVVLWYSETPGGWNESGPRFKIEFRSDGLVRLNGQSGCAIPGHYQYRVPAARFTALLEQFHAARFFSIPRRDPAREATDAPVVKQLGYRDASAVHEVVSEASELPALTALEKAFREAVEAEHYTTPSIRLYRQLLRRGWDVNTLDEFRENALTVAVARRDRETVEFLVQHGATIWLQTLERAIAFDATEIFHLLSNARYVNYRSVEGGRLVAQAARAGNVQLLRELLDRGAPANYRPSPQDETPLMFAVITERPDCVRLLIEHGADLNASDGNGRTALMHAAMLSNTAAIDLLASHGADMNRRAPNGFTALMIASQLCRYWATKALLAHGADPAVKDSRGQTALDQEPASPRDPNCAINRNMLKAALHDLHP